MAYYAFLNANGIVVEVIVGNDEDGTTNWEAYYSETVGKICKRTSFNTHGGVYCEPGTNIPSPDQSKAFRKNFAGIGFTYDARLDAFIPPKEFASWILDEATCLWIAPIPYPDDGKNYYWDEQTISWQLIPWEN